MGNTIRGNAIERPGEPAEVAVSMNLFAKEVPPQFSPQGQYAPSGVSFGSVSDSRYSARRQGGPNWEIPRMPQYSRLVEVTHRTISPHVWKM
jgi:hypothetical protein